MPGTRKVGIARTDPASPGADVSGRERIVRNVLVGWGGQMIFAAAGFILPRFIDRQVGQEGLGVWDFGWSVVSYFGIAQAGIGSSVNRHVAMHRAEEDTAGLNCTVSSVVCIQLLAAVLVVILTALATVWVPWRLESRLGDLVGEARWVIAFLGAGLAVQIAFDSYGGVMTGCHRWDLHSAINAGFHGATVAVMIATLALGGGLQSLAVASFLGILLTEITRAVVARRICPELEIRWTLVRRSRALNMLRFGGKVLLSSVSALLLYQTTSMLIAAYVGVAGLALYARPMALVQHIRSFVWRFAFVLTPTVSSMHTVGQRDAVREFFLETTRYGAYIALPPVLALSILGDPILRLWMGPRYEQGGVLAILALGHLLAIAQAPVQNILVGLDRHGRPTIAYLVGAVACAIFTWFALAIFGWGLSGAALGVALAMTLSHGIYVPAYACRQLGLSVRRYAWNLCWQPLLCAAPFGVCLVAARLVFADRPLTGLVAGLGVGGLTLGVTYWRWVVPGRIHRRVKGFLTKVVG